VVRAPSLAGFGLPSPDTQRDAGLAVPDRTKSSMHALIRMTRLQRSTTGPATSSTSERRWPCVVVAHEHWRADFAAPRAGSCVDITLEEAVVAVNSWVDQIAEAM